MASPGDLQAPLLVGVAFFGLFIFAWVMFLGARIAEIRDATFAQAFKATLAASVVTFASVYASRALGGIAGGAVFLAGVVLVAHMIRVIFHTTVLKAVIVLFVNVLVQMIVAGLMSRMVAGA